MRNAITALALLAAIPAACDRAAKDQPKAPEPAIVASTQVSDELPGLDAPATGIAFWEHPTLAFNGLMIVAGEKGLVSYNMEDGNPVARVDGFDAQGVAVDYLGFGTQAVGFAAFLDRAENTFRFYGIDNNTRAFLPLDPGPVIRGAVRGFCMGRAQTADAPTLFVIQKSKIQLFNLAANNSGVAIAGETTIETPDNIASCTVDSDGVLIVAAEDGALYRVAGENAFATPFAQTEIASVGEIGLVIAAADAAAEAEDTLSDTQSTFGHILMADKASGALHVFDREDGRKIGVVTFDALDALAGVDHADVFAATGANLGGLYRNGVVAFGVGDGVDGPTIRLAPTSSVANALSQSVGTTLSPRGVMLEGDDDGLIIKIDYQPE